MEDSSGCIHMKNLSMQQATNEEEGNLNHNFYLACTLLLLIAALNWLFLGDTNRMIAEVMSRCGCCFFLDWPAGPY